MVERNELRAKQVGICRRGDMLLLPAIVCFPVFQLLGARDVFAKAHYAKN